MRARDTTDLGAADAPRLDDSVLYSCRSTYRAVERYMQRSAREEGLELSQFDVLRVLWEKDGRAQKEISETTRITPSATAQVVHKMESLGLVERREDEHDRRKQVVFLTADAKAIRDRLLAKVADGYDRATRNLSASDRKKYLEINDLLRANLLAMYETDFGDHA